MLSMAWLLVAGVDHWGHWGGPGWWILIPLAWMALIAAAVVGALWWWSRGRSPDSSARAILAERYARGEIDHDEYRQRMQAFS
ncbi:MAG TPA: SHOCT domain-containing protein [Chloroflexota bacterium]|nr:SHOCT domain-containing protein [Chloroflexota bacterium]